MAISRSTYEIAGLNLDKSSDGTWSWDYRPDGGGHAESTEIFLSRASCELDFIEFADKVEDARLRFRQERGFPIEDDQ